MREHFADGGFDEVAFELLPGDEYGFTVALSRHTGEREPFGAHEQVFTLGRHARGVTTHRPRS